jgi:hypothetical protein
MSQSYTETLDMVVDLGLEFIEDAKALDVFLPEFEEEFHDSVARIKARDSRKAQLEAETNTIINGRIPNANDLVRLLTIRSELKVLYQAGQDDMELLRRQLNEIIDLIGSVLD